MRGAIVRMFARGNKGVQGATKDFSKISNSNNTVNSILEDADLNALAKAPKFKERIVVESFKDKTDKIRKEKEQKIMNLEFSELTSSINQGKIDVKQIQLDGIEREKSKLMSHAAEYFDVKSSKSGNTTNSEQVITVLKKKSQQSPKASRALSRLQTLDKIKDDLTQHNLPENLAFPWRFNFGGPEKTAVSEQNLRCVIPVESVINHEDMTILFKNFVNFWASNDWDILEDYAEPLFVKFMKKEMQLLPDKYKIVIPNLKTAKFEFDLYEITNIYMSAANTNRKKSDSIHNFHVGMENQNDVPMHILSKKKPDEGDLAGVVAQFRLNVKTNLCVNVVEKDSNKVVATDYTDNGTKSTVHDFIVEILLATVKNSSVRKATAFRAKDSASKLTNVTNHAHPRNLRVIDMNSFMRGNPILSGFNTESAASTLSHTELASLKRQHEEMAKPMNERISNM